MGSALGHLSNLKPFIDQALTAGHQVTMAAKELHNIETVFPGYDLPLFQAPYLMRKPRDVGRLLSYPHLILQRFETDAELMVLCRTWDTLFDTVEPDVVIYEFAPTALIASLHRSWRKWVIGSGFYMPRVDGPFFGVFPGVRMTPEIKAGLRSAEATLLRRVNRVLQTRGLARIENARQIVTETDSQLLMTLPEVDPYGARPGADYVGIPRPPPSAAPRWPALGKRRIFAYLSSFPSLELFLRALATLDASVLIYSREIPLRLQGRYPALTFVDSPLDLESVFSTADLVVNMGNHSTCAQAVMTGVPQLIIPTKQEKFFTAIRIAAQGWGVLMPPDTDRPDQALTQALALNRDTLAFDPDRRRRLSGPLLDERISALLAELTT